MVAVAVALGGLSVPAVAVAPSSVSPAAYAPTAVPALPVNPNSLTEGAAVFDDDNGTRLLVIDTFASNLIAGDTNNLDDVYLFNQGTTTIGSFAPGSVRRLTLSSTGQQLVSSFNSVVDSSSSLRFDPTGRKVLFTVNARVNPGQAASGSFVVHDIATGVNTLLPFNAPFGSASDDARLIAYPRLGVSVYDSTTGVVRTIVSGINEGGAVTGVAISPDGSRLLFAVKMRKGYPLPYSGPFADGVIGVETLYSARLDPTTGSLVSGPTEITSVAASSRNLAVADSGRTVYVTRDWSGSVSPVGHTRWNLDGAPNPYPAGGRRGSLSAEGNAGWRWEGNADLTRGILTYTSPTAPPQAYSYFYPAAGTGGPFISADPISTVTDPVVTAPGTPDFVGLSRNGKTAWFFGGRDASKSMHNLWRVEAPSTGEPPPPPPTDPYDANGDGRTRIAILGDSYISGEGLDGALSADSYDPRTQVGSGNACHRAQTSWAYRVAEQHATSGHDILFAACSGATTADLLFDSQYPDGPDVPGKKPQLDTLRTFADADSAPIDVVFVSVGGNDAGFATQIHSCAVSLVPCRPSAMFNEAAQDRLVTNIHAVLREVAAATDSTTRIIASGYVNPLNPLTDPCSGSLTTISSGDRANLTAYLGDINTAVATAAFSAGADYLDLEDAFRGRGLCTDSNFMNGIEVGRTRDAHNNVEKFGVGASRESMHPTQIGHGRLLEVARPRLAAILAAAPPIANDEPLMPQTVVTRIYDVITNVGGLDIKIEAAETTTIYVGTFSIPTLVDRINVTAGDAITLAPPRVPTLHPGWHRLVVLDELGHQLADHPFWIPETPGCSTSETPTAVDGDGDTQPDACDPDLSDGPDADIDHDDIANAPDNCITTRNSNQIDTDSDGQGDACDPDAGADAFAGYRNAVDDTTAPAVVADIPEPNAHGWFNTPVKISWKASDNDPSAGPATQPRDVLADVEGENVEYTSDPSCDPVDNCATGNARISLDVTAPRVVASVTPAPNEAGWNNGPVTVTFSCTDPAPVGVTSSGVATCPAPVTISEPTATDGRVITGAMLDKAGNLASTEVTIRIDNTAPAAQFTFNRATRTVAGTVSDVDSGLHSVRIRARMAGGLLNLWSTQDVIHAPTCSSSPCAWSYKLPDAGLGNLLGVWHIEVTAIDRADNITTQRR